MRRLSAVVACAAALLLVLWLGSRPGGRAGPRGRADPAAAGGRTAHDDDAGSPTDELPLPIDLDAVDRDLDLHGVVVRATDGAPVGGAQLVAVAYPGRRTPKLDHADYFTTVEGPSTRSAADGTFALRLAAGASVSLRAASPGFAPVEIPLLQAGERVRVVLASGARLLVKARGKDGTPAAGVGLRLFRTVKFGDVTVERDGRTDARGTFLFDGLPGNVEANLEPRSDRYGAMNWQRVRTPAPGAEAVFEVTLPIGRAITGRVTDSATGAPIPRAQVGMDWTLDRSVLTGEDGRYVLGGWAAEGAVEVHVLADGYGRARKAVGGASEVDLALERGDSARGTLMDAAGRPIGGVRVTALAYRRGKESPDMCSRSADTSEDGSFLVEGLRRDMTHTLLVLAPGHARYLLDFDHHPKGPGTVDLGTIRLPAPQTIAGRVVDADGAPVPRVRLSLRGSNADRGRLTGRDQPGLFFYAETEDRLTDDLGRFRFPDQPPGSFELWVEPTNARPVKRTVDLEPGRDATDVVVELASGLRFVVIVVDEHGVPVPDALLFIQAGSAAIGGRAGADGRATFTVPAAVTRASAQADGADLLSRSVEPARGATEIRIELPKAAHISGRLVSPDGTPLGGGHVQAVVAGEVVASAWTGEDGSFDLKVGEGSVVDLLLEGTRQGRRAIDKGQFEAQTRGVPAGTKDVVLEARAIGRGVLLVRVVFPDGSAAPDVRVILDGARERLVKTDAAGRVRVEGLPVAEMRIRAAPLRDRSGFTSSGPATAIPGGPEVTLVLRAAKTISGTILGPDGRPPERAIVWAGYGDEKFPTECAADGSFAISVPDTPGASWLVEAFANVDKKALRAKEEDVAAGTTDLTLRLGE